MPNELDAYSRYAGNVWEWCSDCFEFLPSSAQINPYNSSWFGPEDSWWQLSQRRDARGWLTATNPIANLHGVRPGLLICRTVPYEGENRPPTLSVMSQSSDEAMIVGVTSVTLGWDSYDPDEIL